MTSKIAEVNKALGSVSYLVGQGYKVTSDKGHESGKDLSLMVPNASEKVTPFRCDRNSWILYAVIN